MRRLKVRNAPSIVHDYLRTASKVVDNTISAVDIFKKQRSNSKTF